MPNKPLSEMTPDEIAALKPEDFKRLADDHNDAAELRENAVDRAIERETKEIEELTDQDLTNKLHDASLDVDEFNSLSSKRRFSTLKTEQNRRDLRFLNGPDNPLNDPDQRELIQTDQRLTPEQREAVKNYDTIPLSIEQKKAILKNLEKSAGGYGSQPVVPARLPNPDAEAEQVLWKLTKAAPPPPFDRKHAREDLTPERRGILERAKDAVRGAVQGFSDGPRDRQDQNHDGDCWCPTGAGEDIDHAASRRRAGRRR